MNPGKRFEADIKASFPADSWSYRLRDNAAGFRGTRGAGGLRFSSDNLCDFLAFRHGTLYLLECKSVGTRSAPLASMFGTPGNGRYPKQKHLEDMCKAAQIAGVVAFVLINYRMSGHTYAVKANLLLGWCIKAAGGDCRKSVPESWCAEYGTRIQERLLKVNYRYDLDGFMWEVSEE